jgi:D-amino-acid dehydrogenase
LNIRRLSREETVELEPALAPICHQLAGALHYTTDETGDAYRYCVALTDHARKLGVTFRFDTVVASLELRSGKIASIVTERGSVTADQYVVAAGSYSTLLLGRVGVQLPVRPAKGYSITFDRPPGTTPLRIPIVDDLAHAVVVPIDDAIRVAGTAEFAGFDQSLNPDRIRNLLALCHEVLPQMRLDPATARPWCALRPMSADGVPIIGPTGISNLYVSTGHGHLGWTMAAGPAQLLADLMSGVTPSLDPSPYDLKRFSPR